MFSLKIYPKNFHLQQDLFQMSLNRGKKIKIKKLNLI